MVLLWLFGNFTNLFREIITLQAGQCGNQVGIQYWNQLANEHGILSDGTQLPYSNEDLQFETRENQSQKSNIRSDRPDLFFTLSDDNKYTPRLIMIDLEPSVITKATSALPMLNPRNIHLSENGGGAANNWQHGYLYGLNHQEDLTNLIDRELDKCENLSTFQLFHSVAGGTGSGVGSLLLELLNDRYGSKKIINTFLIFPSNEKTSDIVVQPYNTMLTLKRLIDFSDCTFVFENDSLNSIENSIFGSSNKLSRNSAFEGTNKLISHIATSISNPFRFPSYMYSSNESIISTLVPTPELKFLSTSVAPITNILQKQNTSFTSGIGNSNLNEYDIILELLNDKCKMNRVNDPVSYISMMNYLIGNNLNQSEIRKGLIRASSRVNFVPWTSASIHLVNGRPPCISTTNNKKNLHGIQISNNTSIVHVFSKIVKQYDLLAKRAAYINYYTESNDHEERLRVMEMFNECRESVVNVIEEYKSCTSLNYLEDGLLEDEDEDIV